MNQKGFSLRGLIIFTLIVFIILLLFISINRLTFKDKNKQASKEETKEEIKKEVNNNNEEKVVESNDTYENLENKLKIAAQRYQNNNYQGTLESTEVWILKYEMLKKEGYFQGQFKDPNNNKVECNGYVIFNKNQARITYTPYIKCGSNYTTQGYDNSKI